MVIYNVTIKIDWSIHEHWLRWVREVHIPDVLATEMFYKYQLDCWKLMISMAPLSHCSFMPRILQIISSTSKNSQPHCDKNLMISGEINLWHSGR